MLTEARLNRELAGLLLAASATCACSASLHAPWEGKLAPYHEACDQGAAAA